MIDIVAKLQTLVYGQKASVIDSRNSVIIEDSESLNRALRNAKRSCSWKKLVNENTSKSRCQNSSNNFITDIPVNDYTDRQIRNQSSILTSGRNRVNDSMNPIASLCNKSQIKSVKVYKLDGAE